MVYDTTTKIPFVVIELPRRFFLGLVVIYVYIPAYLANSNPRNHVKMGVLGCFRLVR